MEARKSEKQPPLKNSSQNSRKRGYKVAAIKHVSEPDFTIDTPGKDTWNLRTSRSKNNHQRQPNETATIEKANKENTPLETLLKKCRGNDIVLIEGLKKLVAKKKKIPKIWS